MTEPIPKIGRIPSLSGLPPGTILPSPVNLDAALKKAFFDVQVPANLQSEVLKILKENKVTLTLQPQSKAEEYALKVYGMMLQRLGFEINNLDQFKKSLEEFQQFLAFREDPSAAPTIRPATVSLTPEVQRSLIEEYLKVVREIAEAVPKTVPKDNPFIAPAVTEDFLKIRDGQALKIITFQSENEQVQNLRVFREDSFVDKDFTLDSIKEMLKAILGMPIENNSDLIKAIQSFAKEKDISGEIIPVTTDRTILDKACRFIALTKREGVDGRALIQLLFDETAQVPAEIKEKLSSLSSLAGINQINSQEVFRTVGLLLLNGLTSEQLKNFALASPQMETGSSCLIIGTPFLAALVSEYRQHLSETTPKITDLSPPSGVKRVKVEQVQEIPDLSPISAIKAVLFSKGVPVSDVGTEILTGQDIKSIIKVFSQDYRSIQAILPARQVEALNKVFEKITGRDRDLIGKIFFSQMGVPRFLTREEYQILKTGELKNRLSALANAATDPKIKENFSLACQALDLLVSREDNFVLIKQGLPPEEIKVLEDFANALVQNQFQNQCRTVSDTQGNSFSGITSLADKQEGLYNDAVRILRRIGWQLQEMTQVMPVTEEEKGLRQTFTNSVKDLRRGWQLATQKQKVKAGNIDLTQIIALKGILFAKGANNLIQGVEKMQARINQLKQQTAPLEQKLKTNYHNNLAEFKKNDSQGYNEYITLLNERQNQETEIQKTFAYLTSDQIDTRFWQNFKAKFPGANRVFDGLAMLEGTMLTDMNGRAVQFPITLSNGTRVTAPFELVEEVLKIDGGWQTLAMMPGESQQTTLAKKTLILMIAQMGLFSENRAPLLGLAGGIPGAGVIPNILVKGGGAAGINAETGSFKLGATRDEETTATVSDSAADFALWKAASYLSAFVGEGDNPRLNVTPYLYLLLLRQTTDPNQRTDFLRDILTRSASAGGQADILRNFSTVNKTDVEKARQCLKQIEDKLNAALRIRPDLFFKFVDELKKDPNLMRALEFEYTRREVHFKLEDQLGSSDIPEGPDAPRPTSLVSEKATVRFDARPIDSLIQNMGDNPIELFLNSQHLSEENLRPGARRLVDAMMAAFSMLGILEASEPTHPLNFPVTGEDVINGLKTAGVTQVNRLEGQGLVGTGEHLSAASQELLHGHWGGPVGSVGVTLKESVGYSVYFGTMPVIFSLKFSRWFLDVAQAANMAKNGDVEGAKENLRRLKKDGLSLFGMVLNYGFNPLAFWSMIKDKIDEGKYAQALGISLAVARFSFYVAMRDFQLIANGVRWVQGRQPAPIQYSFFDKPVEWLVRGLASGANNTAERVGAGQEWRYENLGGRWWEERTIPFLSRSWDSVKSGTGSVWESLPNLGLSESLVSAVDWPLSNKVKRGGAWLFDAYWNKLLGLEWFTRAFQSTGNFTGRYLNPGTLVTRENEIREMTRQLGELDQSLNLTRSDANEVRRALGEIAGERYRGLGGSLTGQEGQRIANKEAVAEVFSRTDGIQSIFVVEPTRKGFTFDLAPGADPRFVIFNETIQKAFQNQLDCGAGIPRLKTQINGKDARLPVKEVIVTSGAEIGYEIFLYNGEPGVALRIGQELLFERGEGQKLSNAVQFLTQQAERADHQRAELVPNAYRLGSTRAVPLEIGQIPPINGRPINEVVGRINQLEASSMRNMTWQELRQLSQEIEEAFTKVKGSENDAEKLVDLMDKNSADLRGIRLTDSSTPTFLELRLAQAREMARRLTDSSVRIGTGKGELPPEVAKKAQRSGMKRRPGFRVTGVQLQGILAMHRGFFAQIFMGEGKTIIFGILNATDALTGKPQYQTTFNDLTARANHNEVELFFDEIGLRSGVCNFQGRTQAALRNTFLNADIIYISQSDLQFIELMNRAVLRGSQRVPIDFENGFFKIDEFDFIVVDEGQNPHIISGPSLFADAHATEWHTAFKQASSLESGKDFFPGSGEEGLRLTDEGKRKLNWDGLPSEQQHRVRKCLEAINLTEGVDYEIRYIADQVILVDKNTGQLKPGHEFSEGLHQALQAKHGLTITSEMETLESVTAAEFSLRCRRKTGASGSLGRIAPLLESKGIKVVIVERSVPEIQFSEIKPLAGRRRSQSLTQVRDLAEDQWRLNGGQSAGDSYGRKVQISCTPAEEAEVDELIENLRADSVSDDQKVTATKKVIHPEGIFLSRAAELDAVVADILRTIDAGGRVNCRPIVIPVEDPLFAEELHQRLAPELKKRGIKLTFDTHNSRDSQYFQIVKLDRENGEVLISTRIRRASDISTRDPRGAILFSLEHSPTSWAYEQKLGRWPRFGCNGEVRRFASMEDPVFRHLVEPRNGRNLLEEVTEIFRENGVTEEVNLRILGQQAMEIIARKGYISYSDVLGLLLNQRGDPSSIEFSPLVEIALQVADNSIFNRENKTAKLFERFRARTDEIMTALERFQNEANVEDLLKGILREEVECLARRHFNGQNDVESFRKELAETLGLKPSQLTLNIAPSATAQDLANATMAEIERTFFIRTGDRIRTGTLTYPESWRQTIKMRFDEMRRELVRRQHRLIERYETLHTGQGGTRWEVSGDPDNQSYNPVGAPDALDNLAARFENEHLNMLRRFRRFVISDLKAKHKRYRDFFTGQGRSMTVTVAAPAGARPAARTASPTPALESSPRPSRGPETRALQPEPPVRRTDPDARPVSWEGVRTEQVNGTMRLTLQKPGQPPEILDVTPAAEKQLGSIITGWERDFPGQELPLLFECNPNHGERRLERIIKPENLLHCKNKAEAEKVFEIIRFFQTGKLNETDAKKQLEKELSSRKYGAEEVRDILHTAQAVVSPEFCAVTPKFVEAHPNSIAAHFEPLPIALSATDATHGGLVITMDGGSLKVRVVSLNQVSADSLAFRAPTIQETVEAKPEAFAGRPPLPSESGGVVVVKTSRTQTPEDFGKVLSEIEGTPEGSHIHFESEEKIRVAISPEQAAALKSGLSNNAEFIRRISTGQPELAVILDAATQNQDFKNFLENSSVPETEITLEGEKIKFSRDNGQIKIIGQGQTFEIEEARLLDFLRTEKIITEIMEATVQANPDYDPDQVRDRVFQSFLRLVNNNGALTEIPLVVIDQDREDFLTKKIAVQKDGRRFEIRISNKSISKLLVVDPLAADYEQVLSELRAEIEREIAKRDLSKEGVTAEDFLTPLTQSRVFVENNGKNVSFILSQKTLAQLARCGPRSAEYQEALAELNRELENVQESLRQIGLDADGARWQIRRNLFLQGYAQIIAETLKEVLPQVSDKIYEEELKKINPQGQDVEKEIEKAQKKAQQRTLEIVHQLSPEAVISEPATRTDAGVLESTDVNQFLAERYQKVVGRQLREGLPQLKMPAASGKPFNVREQLGTRKWLCLGAPGGGLRMKTVAVGRGTLWGTAEGLVASTIFSGAKNLAFHGSKGEWHTAWLKSKEEIVAGTLGWAEFSVETAVAQAFFGFTGHKPTAFAFFLNTHRSIRSAPEEEKLLVAGTGAVNFGAFIGGQRLTSQLIRVLPLPKWAKNPLVAKSLGIIGGMLGTDLSGAGIENILQKNPNIRAFLTSDEMAALGEYLETGSQAVASKFYVQFGQKLINLGSRSLGFLSKNSPRAAGRAVGWSAALAVVSTDAVARATDLIAGTSELEKTDRRDLYENWYRPFVDEEIKQNNQYVRQVFKWYTEFFFTKNYTAWLQALAGGKEGEIFFSSLRRSDGLSQGLSQLVLLGHLDENVILNDKIFGPIFDRVCQQNFLNFGKKQGEQFLLQRRILLKIFDLIKQTKNGKISQEKLPEELKKIIISHFVSSPETNAELTALLLKALNDKGNAQFFQIMNQREAEIGQPGQLLRKEVSEQLPLLFKDYLAGTYAQYYQNQLNQIMSRFFISFAELSQEEQNAFKAFYQPQGLAVENIKDPIDFLKKYFRFKIRTSPNGAQMVEAEVNLLVENQIHQILATLTFDKLMAGAPGEGEKTKTEFQQFLSSQYPRQGTTQPGQSREMTNTTLTLATARNSESIVLPTGRDLIEKFAEFLLSSQGIERYLSQEKIEAVFGEIQDFSQIPTPDLLKISGPHQTAFLNEALNLVEGFRKYLENRFGNNLYEPQRQPGYSTLMADSLPRMKHELFQNISRTQLADCFLRVLEKAEIAFSQGQYDVALAYYARIMTVDIAQSARQQQIRERYDFCLKKLKENPLTRDMIMGAVRGEGASRPITEADIDQALVVLCQQKAFLLEIKKHLESVKEVDKARKISEEIEQFSSRFALNKPALPKIAAVDVDRLRQRERLQAGSVFSGSGDVTAPSRKVASEDGLASSDSTLTLPKILPPTK